MVTLLWTLVWLPVALTAPSRPPSRPPSPANLTITSRHFVHVLTWAPGPGMPPDALYKVTFIWDRGSAWLPVPGCELVQEPLVCQLTQTFSNHSKNYYVKVTALQKDQVLGSEDKTFNPMRDTHLDLPLLTLTPCDGDLCVDLRPPVEDLREIYESLRYSLRISSNGVEGTKVVKFQRREVLKNLSPGRQYCVSVRVSDPLVPRESSYSRAVCGVAPGDRNAAPGTLIAGVLCPVLLLVSMVTVGCLAACGCICPTRVPLPSALMSVHHVEEALVCPGSSLTSLVTVEVAAPPAGKGEALSEENSEEEVAESSGGRYMSWDGCELLSSSAFQPPTGVSRSSSSCQTPPLPPAGGLASATPPRSCEAPADCESEGDAQEEEEERGRSEDVNLLTLTFGKQPEDKLASSLSEEVPSETPAPTWTLCPEEEQEEQKEESGYMCHWTTP